MSNITLAPNASGTATFTIAAPATSTNQVLTLPDQSGTLATVSDVSSSSSMVLLGTVPTTSGTSASLSSLVLANYKSLRIVCDGVSFTASSNLTIGGMVCSTASGGASGVLYGNVDLDLATGVFAGMIYISANNGAVQTGKTSYRNSTNTITFAGGTFDLGQILVYGVK